MAEEAGIFSKQWLHDAGVWASDLAKKLVESVLVGKNEPAGGTAAPGAGTPDTEKKNKWLPFALFGAVLVVVLILFKGKK